MTHSEDRRAETRDSGIGEVMSLDDHDRALYQRRGLVWTLQGRWVEVEFVVEGSIQGRVTRTSPYEIELDTRTHGRVIYWKHALLSIREVTSPDKKTPG